MIDDDKTLAKPRPQVEEQDWNDPNAPAVGRWYWVRTAKSKGEYEAELYLTREEKDGENKRLGCVVHIGSNYAEIQYVKADRHGGGSTRVHFDRFDSICTFEPDADAIVAGAVASRQSKVHKLMGRIQEVTALLSITPGTALGDGNETQALVRHGGNNQPLTDYKQALILAKTKTLPDLFKEIEAENEAMAGLMKASLIPLEAKAELLKPLIKSIESRVFNIELYAGLVEEITQVKEGKPANVSEKIHLFQRRCYMDEECLAAYEAGGMEFKDMGAFDAWLTRPQNLERLLPFPRCIVAFQVRRHRKNREAPDSLHGYIKLMNDEQADKYTYLYIRNGEQVFRLGTEIEFKEKLFPDVEHANLVTGQIYARLSGWNVQRLINSNQYEAMQQAEKVAEVANKAMKAEHKAAMKAFKLACKEARTKGIKKPKPLLRGGFFSRDIEERDRINEKNRKASEGWPATPEEPRPIFISECTEHFVPYNRTSVFYDDISEFVKDQINEHNRLVLVLQGLLDRSPAMHPHPPWQLWTQEGFASALVPIYDTSRALVAGEKPDFEAFRARLNASLKVGSLTVGQEHAWGVKEAEKENDRLKKVAYRNRNMSYRERKVFFPEGNPGPGVIAKVQSISKTNGCKFTWERRRQTQTRTRWFQAPKKEILGCQIFVEISKLLNVSAYKPGDFHQFFDDPRTRADYLQWAPLLLEAEDYYAGKTEVGSKIDAD